MEGFEYQQTRSRCRVSIDGWCKNKVAIKYPLQKEKRQQAKFYLLQATLKALAMRAFFGCFPDVWFRPKTTDKIKHIDVIAIAATWSNLTNKPSGIRQM